jgi:hypothetical protein
VLCGNGSDEILAIVFRTFVDEGDTVAYFDPSYSLYPVLAAIARARTLAVPLPRLRREEEVENLPVPSKMAPNFCRDFTWPPFASYLRSRQRIWPLPFLTYSLPLQRTGGVRKSP